MRDPMTWSFPIGRMFGINIRVWVLLPLILFALILRVITKEGGSVPLGDALTVVGLMFGSILLHEFGHCFAARAVDGDATEVVLWPLGGLAYCDLPHTPKAHLVCALGGPAVNLMLCVFAAGALAFAGLRPSLNPMEPQYVPRVYDWHNGGERYALRGADAEMAAKVREAMAERHDATVPVVATPRAAVGPAVLPGLVAWQTLAAQLFWVNWLGLILTMLPGFPLDGGRVLQSLLWMRGDYRQATATASYAGFIVMLMLGVYSFAANEVIAFALALFVYFSCKQQLILLETGGEDSPFGYDFSQGYTSLEGENAQAAPPKRRRPNFIQRWLQRRAARRAAAEIESRESDERRMDELLEKVQRDGLQSLSDEERRFLTRVSARYRGNKS